MYIYMYTSMYIHVNICILIHTDFRHAHACTRILDYTEKALKAHLGGQIYNIILAYTKNDTQDHTEHGIYAH